MDDREQQRVLRRYKAYAGALLLAAAAAWLLGHVLPLPPGLAGYIRAGAEAGLVGGLADWFAVTALFRRPLGLPIPHTRLIPANQQRIAEGVARYIDGEFLRREMLVEQIRKLDLAGRLARLLDDDAQRQRLVEGLVRVLPRLLESRGGSGMRTALVQAMQAGLADIDLRPAIARLLRGIVAGDDVPILIRDGCDALRALIAARRSDILDHVSTRTPWYLPRTLDRRLSDALIRGLSDMFDELKDPDSAKGRALRDWLHSLPGLVERAEGPSQRVVELIRRSASDPELAHIAGGLWSEIRRMLLEDLKAPESHTRAVLDGIAASLAAQLDSLALRREINAAVEAVLVENVPAWRADIRGFIVETLRRQEPTQFARRIELQVGRDLQFVRINGTVIGALIGIAIHYADRLF